MNTNLSTVEQFDRAKKRLHKALLPYSDLPLHACGEVLAQALGARNLHEAQQHLKTNTSQTAIDPVEQTALAITALIGQHNSHPKERLSWSLSRMGYSNLVALNLIAPHQRRLDDEGFGMFFDMKPASSYHYVGKELAALDVQPETIDLIKRIQALILSVPIHLRGALGWSCLKHAGHWNTDIEFERLAHGEECDLPLVAAPKASVSTIKVAR